MKGNDLVILSDQIAKDFGAESLPEVGDLAELKRLVRQQMQHFLDKDMQGLLNLMYRLDVNEQKFKRVIATSPVETLADDIAEIVIEREIQKFETRRKYS